MTIGLCYESIIALAFDKSLRKLFHTMAGGWSKLMDGKEGREERSWMDSKLVSRAKLLAPFLV